MNPGRLLLLCLLLSTLKSVHGDISSADEVRRVAEDVVAGEDYQIDKGLDESSQALWLTVLTWIIKPFAWLFDSLQGLPMPLRILVTIVLSILLVVLLVHMGYSLVAAVRGKKSPELTITEREQPVDPRELESAARDAAENKAFLQAIRLLFKAAIVRIEQAEKTKLRRGITNRELLRRYRRSPLAEPLTLLVETIDRKWYGDEVCQPSDYELCSDQHSMIQTLIRERTNVVSP